jgi:hypothetical protein
MLSSSELNYPKLTPRAALLTSGPALRRREKLRLTPREGLEYGLWKVSNFAFRYALMAGPNLKGLPQLSSINRGDTARIAAIAPPAPQTPKLL